VVLGSDTAALATAAAAYELETVYSRSDAALDNYTPGGYVSALAPALREASPDYVVFPHTYQSVDYVPRLGQEVGATVLPEVISFEGSGEDILWKRPILGGKLHARVRVRTKGEHTVLLSVQSGAFQADDARAGSANLADLPGGGEIVTDREILGVEQVGGDQVDLTKADVIVAVGRGVGGEDKMAPLEELAKVLGADIGASRPVIDNGWLPRDRQIGSSGQTVAPKLYLAIGISGAIQHLVGMKGANCVVAINKDATAPIFNTSTYGIVGDLHEIVPLLTEAVREVKAG
jgi:electron transfer flavoprotein alpha subunit